MVAINGPNTTFSFIDWDEALLTIALPRNPSIILAEILRHPEALRTKIYPGLYTETQLALLHIQAKHRIEKVVNFDFRGQL